MVLAQAGLVRSGMAQGGGVVRTGAGQAWYTVLPLGQVLPAPGQAALAIQGRADDKWLRDVLLPVNDRASAECLRAERGMLQALQLDCHMPFAAICRPVAAGFGMHVWLADPRTGRSLRLEGAAGDVDQLVSEIVRQIDQAGGMEPACGGTADIRVVGYHPLRRGVRRAGR